MSLPIISETETVMFISEEEARKRLEDSRNIFSEFYVPDVREDADALKNDGAGPISPAEIPDNSDSPDIEVSDIDRLLTGAVNAEAVRRRSGRLVGQTDVQVAIGGVAELLTQQTAGNLFGLSRAQAEAYNRGLSSTREITDGTNSNPERGRRLASLKVALVEKASGRLAKALTSLTDDKIDDLTAPKISAIAKDMAVVMDKVAKDHDKGEAVHFHIWKPEMKKVENYTTVQVGAPLVIDNPGGGADRRDG